eukprot:1403074-Amphidinium_carterae.1
MRETRVQHRWSKPIPIEEDWSLTLGDVVVFLLCIISETRDSSLVGSGTDACRATLFLEALFEVALSKCVGWTLGSAPHAVQCKGTIVHMEPLLQGASTHWRPFWKHVLEEIVLSLARIDSERKHTRAAKAKNREVLVEFCRSVFCRSQLLAELDGISVLEEPCFSSEHVPDESSPQSYEVLSNRAPKHTTRAHSSRAWLHSAQHIRANTFEHWKMAGKSQTMARSVEESVANYCLASRGLLEGRGGTLHLSMDGVCVGREHFNTILAEVPARRACSWLPPQVTTDLEPRPSSVRASETGSQHAIK